MLSPFYPARYRQAGEELKWCMLAHHQLMSQQGLRFSPYSTAKTNDKAHFSGRMVSIRISEESAVALSM